MAPTQTAPARTLRIVEEFTVQAEPLLADEWVNLLDSEGYLVTVIAVDHDDFHSAVTNGRHDALFATMQAAHTAPYWMTWRVVGANTDEVLVRVTNDIREWSNGAGNVAAYNAEVGEEYRITADMLNRIGSAKKG